jgi:hypothetical protein
VSAAQVALSEHVPEGAEIVAIAPAIEQAPLALMTAVVLALVVATTVNVA